MGTWTSSTGVQALSRPVHWEKIVRVRVEKREKWTIYLCKTAQNTNFIFLVKMFPTELDPV